MGPLLSLFDLYLHFWGNVADGNQEVAYLIFIVMFEAQVLSQGIVHGCRIVLWTATLPRWLAGRGVRWETVVGRRDIILA